MQNYAIRECFSRVVSFRLFQCLAAKLGGAIFLLLLIDAPSVWLLYLPWTLLVFVEEWCLFWQNKISCSLQLIRT